LGLEETTVKLLSAFVFGMVICLCGQTFAQYDYYGHQNYYGGRESKWDFNIGVKVVSMRQNNSVVPVVQDFILGTTLVTVGDLSNGDTGVGVDGSIQYNFSNAQSWELRSYFVQWNNNIELGPGSLTTIFVPNFAGTTVSIPEYARTQEQLPGYETSMFSMQLNFKQSIASGIQFVCGPRFISVDDSFGIRSQSPLAGGLATFGDGFYLKNRLYGSQVGLDLRLPFNDRFYISSQFRGGGFANPLTFRRTTYDDVPPILPTATEVNRKQTVFSSLGEIRVRANGDIIPGAVSGYVGYEAVWVGNIGRAYGQLINNTANVATDTLFFQGIVFGFSYRR
jgi:hypothetical protein